MKKFGIITVLAVAMSFASSAFASGVTGPKVPQANAKTTTAAKNSGPKKHRKHRKIKKATTPMTKKAPGK